MQEGTCSDNCYKTNCRLPSGDEWLKRLSQGDQKPNDPPPDVRFTRRAKGREGGPPGDKDKCMLGPRKCSTAHEPGV